jgi:hypothetical protein
MAGAHQIAAHLLARAGEMACWLSGGTGEFRHFHAGPLMVACLAFPDCSWDGPYSFSPHD